MKGFAFSLLISFLLLSAPANAVEVELWPESYFQLQQYRDVDKLRIDKTRFTQYLTLNLYEEAEEPQHFFYSSLRIDLDMGKDTSSDANDSLVEGRSFALMYAYYEAKRLAKTVDLRIGRQVLSDEFGFSSFDGVRIKIYRNWRFGFDLYSGLEVKGQLSEDLDGLHLPNSDTWEPDGVQDDDRLTGVFGASVFLQGFENTNARIQYRHLYSGETDSQDLGVSVRHEFFDMWQLYFISSFSILWERFNLLRFGTRIDLDWMTIELEHNSSRAVFDGDSIFNLFEAYNSKELGLHLFFAPDDRTNINVSYSRSLRNDDSILFDDWGHNGNASHEGGLTITRLLGQYWDLRGNYSFALGWGGDYHYFSLGAGTYVWQRRIRFELDGMGTYFNRLTYNDILLGSRNRGVSWGVAALSELRLHEELSLTFRVDANSNDYIKRQFAVYALLDVHTWH